MAKQILLIDHKEGSIYKVLQESLPKIGYNVLAAENSEKALSIIKKTFFPIVIIDDKAYGTDIIEFIEKIKHKSPDTEIIVLVDQENIILATNSLKHGASDFVVKPIVKDAIPIALKRAYEKFSMRRELYKYRNSAQKPTQIQSEKLIEQERVFAVCQIVELLSSFITNIADDIGSDTIYLNEMPCFVSIHNKDHEVVATNELYKNRLGDKRGHNSWEIYSGQAADRNKCPVGKTFKSGMIQRSKETVECLNGFKRPVVVHSAPIKNRNNDVELVVEMAADIRAVTRLRQELRSTQQRYQYLFDEAPCYIYILDKELRFVEVNKLFKEDFGDAQGAYCYKIYKQRDKPCQNCPTAKTFEDEKVHQGEMIMTSKIGENITVLLSAAPVYNVLGEITQVMVMATNITQIRKLQDHLSSLGLMIGSISHGVKGLLTGLDSGMYMLNSGFAKKDQDQIEEGWEVIKLMVSRIRSLVLDILYYAKERELQWEKTDVLTFANDVALTAGLKIRSKNIDFKCNFDEFLGKFEVDSGIVHSALINILENAIDACVEDKSTSSHTIVFGVTQDQDNIILDVHDNGLGMDKATQKNMFNIFFSSKAKKGTGLGLFISNKIIQQHGGSIKVTSKQGCGSYFSIIIPKMLPESAKYLKTNK